MPILHVLAAFVLFGAWTAADPADWPGLWGASRNGEAAAPPASLPAAAKELWRRPVTGGYSEVAIAGGRAVSMELRDGQDFVVALDAATGREQWSARVAPTYKGHDGSDDGPIATPAIDGADVFAVGPNGHLVALDAATGKERWRHDLVAEFDAEIPGWGFGSSRRCVAFCLNACVWATVPLIARLPWPWTSLPRRSAAILRRRRPLSGSKKYERAAPKAISRRRPGRRATSVAPVEVARLAPEPGFLRHRLLGGPGVLFQGLRSDRPLLAVHRLLEPRLLLGLEERMILERILVLVPIERYLGLELGVPLLQLEMILDHLCE